MKKDSASAALLRLILKLLIIALFAMLLTHFVLGVFIVHTNDMFPAVRDGDLFIGLRPKSPAYGDIVAYRADGQRRFGRIVGLEGDVIEMDGGGNYRINGSIPYESVYYETRAVVGADVQYPYTVGKDEMFVLNDLRDNTGDSRIYGAIPHSETEGSLVLLLRRRSW